MLAIITRRKLLDILSFSFVVGLLYYYSSRLSLPSISIKYQTDSHQHLPDDARVGPLGTRILHPSPPAGFAAFSRLYVHKGTLYAVVRDQKSKKAYPPVRSFISHLPSQGTSQSNEPTNDVSVATLLYQRECLFLKGNEDFDRGRSFAYSWSTRGCGVDPWVYCHPLRQ